MPKLNVNNRYMLAKLSCHFNRIGTIGKYLPVTRVGRGGSACTFTRWFNWGCCPWELYIPLEWLSSFLKLIASPPDRPSILDWWLSNVHYPASAAAYSMFTCQAGLYLQNPYFSSSSAKYSSERDNAAIPCTATKSTALAVQTSQKPV